jgi:hypothetical protein
MAVALGTGVVDGEGTAVGVGVGRGVTSESVGATDAPVEKAAHPLITSESATRVGRPDRSIG